MKKKNWGKITNINKSRKKNTNKKSSKKDSMLPKNIKDMIYDENVYGAYVYDDGGYYSLGKSKTKKGAESLIEKYKENKPGMKNKSFKVSKSNLDNFY